MENRRNFMKTSFALAAGAVAGNLTPAVAAQCAFPGVLYTRENPGRWAKKVGSHLPIVTVNGNKVTVETKHGMSKKHYIVRHTLVTAEGKVLGAKTFRPSDEAAVSEYEISGKHPVIYATSFCNKHDMWVAEFSV